MFDEIILGRRESIFAEDLMVYEQQLVDLIQNSRFLLVGGAGSIGQAVVRRIFAYRPAVLHVVDISENNLVELVRDLRSGLGYIEGDFRTFPLDVLSTEFDCMLLGSGNYDYVLNLAALKHVRSEKDPWTLMRLIDVNIFATMKLANLAEQMDAKKMFCVSTDKAAAPVNMMGASKRLMELFLFASTGRVSVSTARFANVAFSDGSLLFGFHQRFMKRQPISAPSDTKRFFVSQEEAGVLCVFSALLGEQREIFFPKLSEDIHLSSFTDLAERYLKSQGFDPVECESEEHARESVEAFAKKGKWPVWYFESDTTGEKPVEQFYTPDEVIDWKKYSNIGVIKAESQPASDKLEAFVEAIDGLKRRGTWEKAELVALFRTALPEFQHAEMDRYLDDRM